MDSDERFTALQKAYADMILNTSKEAAARVMVADRRALRYQHELNSSREQALQMMMRLKQMLDTQVKEAGESYVSQQLKIQELTEQLQGAQQRVSEVETACLSQQRKIEELEAQLGEAEDIVTELRDELRKERTQPKSGGIIQFQVTGEHDTPVQDPPSQEKRPNTPPAPVVSPELPVVPLPTEEPCQQITDTVPPPDPQVEKTVASEIKSSSVNPSVVIKPPERPSAVLINKVPEPLRYGRAQRIRAFEEKLLAGELAFGETTEAMAYQTNRREGRKSNSAGKMSSEKGDIVQPHKRSANDVVTLKSFRKKIKKSRKLSKRRVKRDKNPDIRKEEDPARNNAPSDGDAPRVPVDMSEKETLGESTEEALKSLPKKIRTSRRLSKGGLKSDKNPDTCTEEDSSRENAQSDGNATRVPADMSEKRTLNGPTEEFLTSFRKKTRTSRRLSNRGLKRDENPDTCTEEDSAHENAPSDGDFPRAPEDMSEKETLGESTEEPLISFRKKIRTSRKLSKLGLKRDKNPDTCTEEDSARENAPSDGDAPRAPEDMSEKETLGDSTEEPLISFRKKIRTSRKLSKLGLKRDKNPDTPSEEDSARENAPSDGDARRVPEDISEKKTLGESTEEAPEAVGVESTGDKEKSLAKDKVPVKGQGTQTPDDSELAICDGKTDKASETSSLVSTSNGNLDRLLKNGFPKFFYRKRKRETASNSNTSLESDIVKNKAEQEQNSPKRRRLETQSNSDGNTSLELDALKKKADDGEQNSPKRREETLSNSDDGNTSLEEDVLKKKAADKQNSPTVMEKCSNVKESSGDSRNLALVAHQLISLSDQKW